MGSGQIEDETTRWPRRAVLAGALALGGCASLSVTAAPPVHVHLLQGPPAPPPDGAPEGGEAALQTGFDAVQRMTVPVTIQDGGPFTFVVDTGANHSVIAADAAQALGLPSAGRAAVHGIAGVDPAETVQVRRLQVGGFAARRVRMPVLPRHHLGADGLLGVDVLAGRHMIMDFEANQFSIAASSETFRREARTGGSGRLSRETFDPSVVVVPARYRFGQLTIIDAEVGAAIPITAFLDSGAQSTVGNLALRRAVYAREPSLALRAMQVQLVSATGQMVSGELAPLPGLRLGGLRIGNLSCVFADLHTFAIWDLIETPAILIGMDVMRHFRAIELDYARREVVFRTPTPTPTPPTPSTGRP